MNGHPAPDMVVDEDLTPEQIDRLVELGAVERVLRECDCPYFSIACAHFGEAGVGLIDTNLSKHRACVLAVVPHCSRYAVTTWSQARDFGACERCGDPTSNQKTNKGTGFTPGVFVTEDFAEARAEFRRREALLLGRDPI